MENINNDKHIKPIEILELEKELGVEIEGIYEDDFDSSDLHNFSEVYVYNENIIVLSIQYNQIVDLTFLKNFPYLQELYLNANTIKDISPIASLTNLEALNLQDNDIEDILPLANLQNLRSLTLLNNPIKNVYVIQNLKNLRILDLDDLDISDLSFIQNLYNLNLVFLSNNNVDDISHLTDKQIETLFLNNNNIKFISKEFAQNYALLNQSSEDSRVVVLENNPLEFPPYSVIEQGPYVLQSYYQDAETYNHKALAEGRIIFIGDGGSGKTSIIDKVVHDTYTHGRQQTNGIKIEHINLQIPDTNDLAEFHIWDFGGQEIQHAVHKFFFAQGCLYVLVLDSRKEEDPEYWLQQIESLGGRAPVLVVFNKQDENSIETVDRKYLKEKYPNIVDFYKTSCVTNAGIGEFKQALYANALALRSVVERFPVNWLNIKNAIQQYTSGAQHYLSMDVYKEICKQNNTANENAQKLILRYLNTIGAVTWFGDDVHLNMLHVLQPKWITQGVYKIITAKTTANRYGQIQVSDFRELLQPINSDDYTYDESHYGFILSTMEKFKLCYTVDNKTLLIPSAFGKEPKIEYSNYRGENVRTYYLQFKHYMPLALIHRFITMTLSNVYDNNYWYTGIVLQDSKTDVLSLVHADKEAKRIYIRIKGQAPLGAWEHIRRLLAEATKDYAKIEYDEMVMLDERLESSVSYADLLGHLAGNQPIYFDPKLKRRYNVGYLMGMFEDKKITIDKLKTQDVFKEDRIRHKVDTIPAFVLNILNNNSNQVSSSVNVQIDIDIDVNFVNQVSSEVAGDINYLLSIVDEQNKAMIDTLKELLQFTNDAKEAKTSSDVVSKGWKRKLKNVIEGLGKSGETIKNIKDGGEVLGEIFKGIKELAHHFGIDNIQQLLP